MEVSQETEEEKQEKRLQEGIGVPQIIVDCADSSKTAFIHAVETGKLPSVEEVSDCMQYHAYCTRSVNKQLLSC